MYMHEQTKESRHDTTAHTFTANMQIHFNIASSAWTDEEKAAAKDGGGEEYEPASPEREGGVESRAGRREEKGMRAYVYTCVGVDVRMCAYVYVR